MRLFYAHNCVSYIVNTPWSWINEAIHQEISGTFLGYGSSDLAPGRKPLDPWTPGPWTAAPPVPTIFDGGNLEHDNMWRFPKMGGYPESSKIRPFEYIATYGFEDRPILRNPPYDSWPACISSSLGFKVGMDQIIRPYTAPNRALLCFQLQSPTTYHCPGPFLQVARHNSNLTDPFPLVLFSTCLVAYQNKSIQS